MLDSPPWRALGARQDGVSNARGTKTPPSRTEGLSDRSMRRFRADLREIMQIEGLERDSWKSGPASSSATRTRKGVD